MSASEVTGRPAVDARSSDVWVVEPRSMGVLARLREVWRYRYLFSYFSRQTLRALFRQSALAWLWILLRSGAMVVITAFVFGAIARFPSGDLPYLLFVVVGMTAWNLFEFTLLSATRAMTMHARLVTRVYFPRIILVPTSTIEALLRTGVMLILTLAVALYFLIAQGQWHLQLGPRLGAGLAALLLSWLLGVALGLWTSVLEAPARDIRYSVRYTLRFWFFLTPVVYPLSFVPEQWQWLIALNPLTGIVELYRWAVLGGGELHPVSLTTSVTLLAVAGIGGLVFFGRAEAKLLDAL